MHERKRPHDDARRKRASASRRRTRKPRAVKVIALDAAERAGGEAARRSCRWNRANFLTASAFAGAPARSETFSMAGWLSDLAGRTKDLSMRSRAPIWS